MSDSSIFNPQLEVKVNEVEGEFVHRAEEVLSSSLNREIKVSLKDITSFDFKAIKADFPKNTVFITVGFHEGFEGNTLFLLDPENVAYLADLMMMGEGDATFESDEHLDAIHEIINQLMADYGRTLSTLFDRQISYSESRAVVIDISPADFQDSNWVRVRLEIDAGKKIEMSKLVSWSAIHKYVPESESAVEEFLAAPEEMGSMLPDMAEESEPDELRLLMDIDLPITIELGRTQMMIKNILKLSPGSIVELDKLSGEPVDLFVNSKKFAEGEVVVIDENFGVRITEIVQVDERIRKLEG